ncbi:glutamyl-tRNA reductase [Cytophagales bacterium LB-30]|uniref:Glutamyl-tRNA reductase n=1 Tax=Shiella aurantiaca TaxID=3058365 RepID=A0ABT8F3Z4_9BACT|nr:glutamyl-tRNA reductase [Shiella aurantiaca]MDN4164721.1 glutamyl-tRNA reductase [Shiella aurantiaca]
MHSNFRAITLNYKTSPLEVREAIALDEQGMGKLMAYFKEYTDLNDVLILSTCNRTEVYYSAETDFSSEIIRLIGVQKGLLNMDAYASHFQIISHANDAVRHLYRVGMGLESQVVGDIQISNQVKRAYQLAADNNLAGPFLHRLMHSIFFTHKRVAQETPFREGAASVSYAAAELAEELAQQFVNPKVLVLGLGEIGEDVCRNLENTKLEDITICNRTLAKAEALAASLGYKVAPFEQAKEEIKQADVIITSLSLNEPFITKEMVESFGLLHFKFFIDLSVPRNVAVEVEEIPGALVYNIDTINARTNEALEKRLASIPQVEAIIEEALVDFKDWTREMMVSPTIHKLINALEVIRQEEMARYMKELSQEESQKMEKITKSMMQKIIKLPVLQLKAACKRGEAETLIDVLNDLFDLEKQPSQVGK